ncbi:ABC transporter permease [uncultured Clostridium sp.]|uniref:ABC transporter permease n=1 Tax=uncultured Clostridium sp. TaxID=59620 RepID=UPI0025E80F34|nr:ABC transporter permease [uncultured Clostridium sp.]
MKKQHNPLSVTKRGRLNIITECPAVLVMIALIVVCSIYSSTFYSYKNLMNILMQSTVTGIMAVGMTLLVINGHFDLSLGVTMAMAAMITAKLQNIGIVPAILIAILASIIVGLINGVFIVKFKINCFIVTLAMMMIIRGINYLISEKGLVLKNSSLRSLAKGNIGGVYYYTFILIIVIAIAEFLIRRTRHGRNTFAIGGNAEFARNVGINVNKVTILNFIIASTIGGAAGVLQLARQSSATPLMGYPNTAMDVLACVVLGGTKLSGGYGGMYKTLAGVLTMQLVQNGMNMLKCSSQMQDIVSGVVLILIIAFDRYNGLKKKA